MECPQQLVLAELIQIQGWPRRMPLELCLGTPRPIDGRKIGIAEKGWPLESRHCRPAAA